MQGFHLCSEGLDLENHSGENNDIDPFEKYNKIKLIGEGEYGKVYKVRNNQTQKEYAMRVSNKDTKAVNAIDIACALNSLNTPAFVHTYGWNIYRNKMYMLMEYHDETFESKGLNLTPTEYKTIAFILLHGLYIGRKKLQFEHDDIHTGQILLKSIKRNVPIAVGNEFQLIGNSRFIPKFIDFELGRIGEEEDEGDLTDSDDLFSGSTASTDIPSLRGALVKHMRKNKSAFLSEFEGYISKSKAWNKAEESDRFDYQSILLVLGEPFWYDIMAESVEQCIRCHNCHDVANFRLEHTQLYFCDAHCAKRIIGE